MKNLIFFFFLCFSFISLPQEKRFESWTFETTDKFTGETSAILSASTIAVRNVDSEALFYIYLTHKDGGSLRVGLFDENLHYPNYNGGKIEVNIKFRDEEGNFSGPEDSETLNFVSEINRFFEGYDIDFKFYEYDYGVLEFVDNLEHFSCYSYSKEDCSNLYIQTVYKGESKVFRVPATGFIDALAYLKNWYKDTIDPFQEDKKPLGG